MMKPLLKLSHVVAGLLVFVSMTAHAEFKIEDYKLNENQKKIIYAMIKKGRSEADLTKMAKLLEKSKPHVEYKPQIPPHTLDELTQISRWSAGGAFRYHAVNAGFNFDFKTYMNDCPNMAIFNFGRATGMQYLRQDVMQNFINAMFALNYAATTSPETFAVRYAELAQAFGMSKYISPMLTP